MNVLELLIIISSTQLLSCSEPNYISSFKNDRSQQGKMLTYAQKNPGEYVAEKIVPVLYNLKFQTDSEFKRTFDPWAGRKRAERLKNIRNTKKLLHFSKSLSYHQGKRNSGHSSLGREDSYSKPQKRKILFFDESDASQDETLQELSIDTSKTDCNTEDDGFKSYLIKNSNGTPSKNAYRILSILNEKRIKNKPETLKFFDVDPNEFETKDNYNSWEGNSLKSVPVNSLNDKGFSNYKQEGKITSEFNNRVRNFIFLSGGNSYHGLYDNGLNDLNEYILNNNLKNPHKLKPCKRIKRELLNGKTNLNVLNDDQSYYIEENKSYVRQNNIQNQNDLNLLQNDNKLSNDIFPTDDNIDFDKNQHLEELEEEVNRKSQNKNKNKLEAQKVIQNYSSLEEKKIAEFLRGSRSMSEGDIEREGNQTINYIQSNPYRNLRNFEPWAGKRNFNIHSVDGIEEIQTCSNFDCFKRLIPNKRNVSKLTSRNLRNFDAWGGKRSYNAWGGKRSYSPWGGKRSYNAWGGKRSYSPWGGKRSYNAWGGKRSYSPWGGKRNYDVWVTKRSYSPWGGKRNYNAWGGKRSYSPWGGKRNYNAWGGKRSYNPWGKKRNYNAWGGKRTNKFEKTDENVSYNEKIKKIINDFSFFNPNNIKSDYKGAADKKSLYENPESKIFFVKGDINTWINKTRKFNSWGGKRTLMY